MMGELIPVVIEFFISFYSIITIMGCLPQSLVLHEFIAKGKNIMLIYLTHCFLFMMSQEEDHLSFSSISYSFVRNFMGFNTYPRENQYFKTTSAGVKRLVHYSAYYYINLKQTLVFVKMLVYISQFFTAYYIVQGVIASRTLITIIEIVHLQYFAFSSEV